MVTFAYKAINKQGETLGGVIEAESLEQAQDTLAETGFSVLDLRPETSRSVGEINIGFLDRVTAKDVVVFSRQLAMMVSSDITIVQSLRILFQQTSRHKLKTIISKIADEVEAGAKLSEAMAPHVNVFGNFYLSMIKSGETAGKLDEVLIYLADQLEKDYDLNAKIKGAMIYPVFIFVAMAGVSFVMITFILPKLTAILKESNVELPVTTKLLIAISDFAQKSWWLLLIILVGAIIGLQLFRRTKVGKRWLDTLLVYLPIFGPLLVRKIYIVRFMRSLSTLLQGGVPLPESLRIVSEVITNSLYQGVISRAIKEVEDGNPLASVFVKEKLFPPMVSQLIVVGEQTGKIETMLGKMSGFYEREIENVVANLTVLLEPMILLMMGVGVGGMAVSIMLPMFKLAQAV